MSGRANMACVKESICKGKAVYIRIDCSKTRGPSYNRNENEAKNEIVQGSIVMSSALKSSLLFGTAFQHKLTSFSVQWVSLSLNTPSLLIRSISASYNENPFASTHSLDANPFEDPPAPSANDATRLEQLRQRELDLERREREVTAKADQMRRHGRNNWPPCKCIVSVSPVSASVQFM